MHRNAMDRFKIEWNFKSEMSVTMCDTGEAALNDKTATKPHAELQLESLKAHK
jgi:hypothetical protein